MRICHKSARIWGLALVLPLLLAVPSLGAQNAPGLDETGPTEPVEDEELDGFAVAFLKVQEINSELTERTDERVEESELSVERFYEINQLAQQSDSSEGLEGVDDTELAEYQTVLEDVLEIQNSRQAEMVEVVEEEELSVDRFNEIMLGIREDQELAARAEEALEEATEEREAQN
ncbi:MAG: DUF4168 domain-containing protein [Spirochaetota bacterium]